MTKEKIDAAIKELRLLNIHRIPGIYPCERRVIALLTREAFESGKTAATEALQVPERMLFQDEYISAVAVFRLSVTGDHYILDYWVGPIEKKLWSCDHNYKGTTLLNSETVPVRSIKSKIDTLLFYGWKIEDVETYFFRKEVM